MTQKEQTVGKWIALALACSLAGCASDADKARIDDSATRAKAHGEMPERLALVDGALSACEPLRSAGDRPWSAAADCYNGRFAQAFAAGDAPDKPMLFVNLAARSQIADRVDRAAITVDQGRSLLASADKGMVDGIRTAIKPPDLKTLQKEHAQAVAAHQELLQRQADTEALLQAFERIKPRP